MGFAYGRIATGILRVSLPRFLTGTNPPFLAGSPRTLPFFIDVFLMCT
jgi:hypothetical protein